jgi:hypothetical protein
MIRFLLVALALAGACQRVLAAESRGKSTPRESMAPWESMKFEWHAAPSGICREQCNPWISAVGPVTASTPADFENFVSGRNLTATVVLESNGGSVTAAMELGRKIRELNLTTAVGRTGADMPPSGSHDWAGDAVCSSMCVFVLLGGSQRYISPQAQVLVHQIWITKKRKRIVESAYTADEMSLVQRDIGRLARYTIEMGGDIELLDIALQVPAWEAMHRLSSEEIKRTRLGTAEEPPAGSGEADHAATGLVPIPEVAGKCAEF